MFCDASKDIEIILWKCEKYWQCQLFTSTHGVDSSISDSYSKAEKVAEKSNLFITTFYL